MAVYTGFTVHSKIDKTKILMDFDQICIDTLLGGGKCLIYFGDLDLIFKVTVAL